MLVQFSEAQVAHVCEYAPAFKKIKQNKAEHEAFLTSFMLGWELCWPLERREWMNDLDYEAEKWLLYKV